MLIIIVCEQHFNIHTSNTGVGNYFHTQAILSLYMCLSGQIQVKYGNSKLKTGLRGMGVARGPYVAPSCSIIIIS